MTKQYKVGDVLLCHKHVGIAKYVGQLNQNDYKQLPSNSQTFIKPTDIWVGLQLAEKPNSHKQSLMIPYKKLQNNAITKAISYHYSNAISFADYFKAHYGILIPYKYIHKKINSYQILSKLTHLFHTLKETQKQNAKLAEKLKKLQSDMKLRKKIKSTSQKSLKSVIYDQNGNSYHHHEQITHTTTHSYKSSHKHFKENKNNDIEEEDDSTVVTLDSHATNPKPIRINVHKNTANDQQPQQQQQCKNVVVPKNNNLLPISSPFMPKNRTSEDSQQTVTDIQNSLSERATNGIDDSYSDRHMSDDDDEPPIKALTIPNNIKTPNNNNRNKNTLSPHLNFNREDIINEDGEQDYHIHSRPNPPRPRPLQNTLSNQSNVSADDRRGSTQSQSGHVRRYSAPWDDKKLKGSEFGSDYDRLHDPYWKTSGTRSTPFQHNQPMNHMNDGIDVNDESENKHSNENENDNNIGTMKRHKHQTSDSTETLPMIKEDPTTHRIYKLTRAQRNRQNHRGGHTRSVSMSVVNVPRYFFEADHEFPDLPDL